MSMSASLQRRCFAVFAFILLPLGMARAESLQWSGEVGASLWSSDRQLNHDRGLVVGHAKMSASWQPVDQIALQTEGSLVSLSNRHGHHHNNSLLKEWVVEFKRMPCTPALGKRFISWGKTDALNPTDLLSPTDYRRLVNKDTDQREGAWGLHLNCPLGPGRVQAHLLDPFHFNQVPLQQQPGIEFEANKARLRPSGALRYEVMGEMADWSVSYINGYDLWPTLTLRSMSPQGLRIGRSATPMRMVGADMAISQGAMIYRAETAWVDYPRAFASNQTQRRPYFSTVIQAERSLGDRHTISAQVFAKHLRGSLQPPANPIMNDLQSAQALISNELDRDQVGLTFRYARPLWESRGEMDVFAVYSHPRNDWMMRGRLHYSLSDTQRFSVGFDLLRGPQNSYLGNLRDNSLIFAEIATTW